MSKFFLPVLLTILGTCVVGACIITFGPLGILIGCLTGYFLFRSMEVFE